MEEKQFKGLIDKYLNGTASDGEQALLEEYYSRLESKDRKALNQTDEVWLQDSILQKIQSGKNIDPAPSTANRKRLKSYVFLAAAIMLAITSTIYLQQKPESVAASAKKQAINPEVITPGGNRALLTLADGSKIILDDAQNGVIATESGISISKTEEGQLVYTVKSSENTGQEQDLQFNTIETPKGGQYRINLPDGSKVWLNAASSLKFPARFAKHERKVELSGEAYFEIHPDKRVPFKIRSATQAIEVLGTHFNVNAYSNEPSINTTLVEGSVKVSDISTNNTRILKPGQEARNSKNGALAVSSVNTEDVISWTKGEFQFNDTELIHIMRQLERWYDVDVDYSQIPKTRYNAHISRNIDLEKVLEVLEVTGRIKFQIEGKTIKILPKKGK